MASVQRWEYKSFAVWDFKNVEEARKALHERADRAGQEGWEMVNFAMGGVTTMVCFMKRPM